MKIHLPPYVYPVMKVIPVLLAAALVFPQCVRAECKEVKIVEYEDRVEAVCVGEPLTEAQIKAQQEEQKKQDMEAQRQRVEDQNRQREAARASKTQEEAAAAARKKRELPPATPQPPANRNTTTNPQILIK